MRNSNKATANRQRATAAANRKLHRIKGLLIGLEQLMDSTYPEGEDKTWSDVGSLAHIEEALAQAAMHYELGTDESEEDCLNRILANVDPEGEADMGWG